MSSVSEVFDLFVKQGSSTVTATDVGYIVRAQSLSPTLKELEEAIATAGAKGGATKAQCESIVKALARTKIDDVEGTTRRALKLFDHDDGDVVKVSELSYALTKLGDKLTTEEINEIFRQASVDNFGQITIDTFAALMRRATGEEENAFA